MNLLVLLAAYLLEGIDWTCGCGVKEDDLTIEDTYEDDRAGME